MKILNALETQQVAGAVLHVDGYNIYVPSTGIPDYYYTQIDSFYDQMFNNKITLLQGADLLANIPDHYIETYISNIDNAYIY